MSQALTVAGDGRWPRIRVGAGRHVAQLPLVLGGLHQELPVQHTVRVAMEPRNTRGWGAQRGADLAVGAGFLPSGAALFRRGVVHLTLIRLRSLPDTVCAGMKLLIVGLNPSPSSADAGIGYARPGNRFWPAALKAGLVSVDRDPRHALQYHGLGMTDIVRRTTRRADEIDVAEYNAGFARIIRLAQWLRPKAICFVGLSGWRNVVDRSAQAGVQKVAIGRRPVYLMPHTSGLNAHCRLDDLVEHFSRALALANKS